MCPVDQYIYIYIYIPSVVGMESELDCGIWEANDITSLGTETHCGSMVTHDNNSFALDLVVCLEPP
jgi:hypothetical protein